MIMKSQENYVTKQLLKLSHINFLLSLSLPFLSSFPEEEWDEGMKIIKDFSIHLSHFNQKVTDWSYKRSDSVSVYFDYRFMVILRYYSWIWHLLSCIITLFHVLFLEYITKNMFNIRRWSLSIEINVLQSDVSACGPKFQLTSLFSHILFCKIRWTVLIVKQHESHPWASPQVLFFCLNFFFE